MARKPLTEAQIEQRRAAGRKRAQQFTSESQRAARAHVSRETLQANGRKGYAANVRKYGAQFAADKFAVYRKNNPSDLEKIMIGWLDDLGVRYTREYAINGCYFDFHLPDFTTLIEVDGDAFHGTTVHGENRVSRDTWKTHTALWHGYGLLRLKESELADGTALNALLAVIEPQATTLQHAEMEEFPIGHPFTR